MKAVVSLMLMTVVVFAAGCKKSDDPSNGGNNNGGGGISHEYVDLGLPSGTLWATCNVGATKPEGFGDYFAWGETEPKTTYDESTYKWCVGELNNYGYYDYKYTKYCDSDQLTILQAGDDAATANWGSDWRMPDKEQWQELIDNTTSAWTTRNEVYGRIFYGNGQSLFLPAAKVYIDNGVVSYNSGKYWSRSLYNRSVSSAWLLSFDVDDCELFIESYSGHSWGYRRCYGCSVRPVRSAK